MVEHSSMPVRRAIIDEITPENRLTAIAGSRAIGKTTLLLAYAREHFKTDDRRCLYINLNDFYFTDRPLREFAAEFSQKGGTTLLIDQIFKYPDWQNEINWCFDNLHDLSIIFTVSPLVKFDAPETELAAKIKVLQLRGFSFREYIDAVSGTRFPTFSFDEILENHQKIAADICSKIKPLAYFENYLNKGYYPFFQQRKYFSETLLKAVNITIEVDLLLINQLNSRSLSKIRRLLYLLAMQNSQMVNISRLSEDCKLSRYTTSNCIRYLSDAQILNLIGNLDAEINEKPAQCFIQNTNLLQVIRSSAVDVNLLSETFFVNQISPMKINTNAENQFLIDNRHIFSVGDRIRGKFNPDCYYAVSGIETGERRVIPLWLFGFLY